MLQLGASPRQGGGQAGAASASLSRQQRRSAQVIFNKVMELDLHSEPPLGAHVVTPRRWYTHHAIYVGRGRVVQYRGWSRSHQVDRLVARIQRFWRALGERCNAWLARRLQGAYVSGRGSLPPR